jgi:hypothetical protein
LKSKFDEKINRLNKEDFLFDANTVDRDNPKRIPIKQAVRERLSKAGWKFSGAERVIYGYAGANFVMYQKNFVDESTHLVIRISTSLANNKDVPNAHWKSVFGDEKPLEHPYPSYWEIESPKLPADDDVKKYAEKFSDFAQAFFSNTLKR